MDLSRRHVLKLGGIALAATAVRPSHARGQTPKRGGTLALRTWDPPHFDPFQTISYKTHIALSFTHSRLLKHGVAAQVSGEPPVFDIFFTDHPIVDYRATLTADRERIKRFNAELLRRGVVKAVNKIYVSLAHTDEDVDETLEVFDQTLAVIAESA